MCIHIKISRVNALIIINKIIQNKPSWFVMFRGHNLIKLVQKEGGAKDRFTKVVRSY